MGGNTSDKGTENGGQTRVFTKEAPFKLVFYSATGIDSASLSAAIGKCLEEGLDMRVSARTQAQLFDKATREAFVGEAMRADALLVTLHGGADSFAAWEELEKALEANPEKKPYVHVQPSDADPDGLAYSKKNSTEFGGENFAATRLYLLSGGWENYRECLRHLMNVVGGTDLPLSPPRPQLTDGIYHPDLNRVPELEEYLETRIDPSKPTVGIIFFQTSYLNGNLSHIDGLARAVEKKGANVLPVFHMRFADKDLNNRGANRVLRRHFLDEKGNPRVDVILSAMAFSVTLTCPDAKELFRDIGVPVIQATICYASREIWESSDQGLPTKDVSMSAAQPEFDGNIISVPFAFREQTKIDPLTRSLSVSYEPDPERAEKLASLAINWGKLRRTPVSERRVGIVFHHYPPRNDRIGCASGLDSFRSVSNILKSLKEKGYRVENTFGEPDELSREILSRMTHDGRFLTPDQMSARAEARAGKSHWLPWHEELPESIGKKMTNDWGPLPGELFAYRGEMLFPGLATGNVFVTVQPPRGLLENVEAIYHDLRVSPPHNYLAQYRWLRDVWKAQVLIHVGKHGSLEWLPGKALGLSETCYPDLSIMDIPNVYPYIINNPGEGTQAKRRSYAAIIDHLTPAFTNADLYDELGKVDGLTADLRLAEKEDPKKVPAIKGMIIDATVEANLDKDLNLTRLEIENDFDAFLEKLHAYLDELWDTMIADGLHVLGEAPEGKPLDEFLVQLTRVEGPEAPSLRETLLRARGFDYDELLNSRGKSAKAFGGKTGAEILRENHLLSLELMAAFSESGHDPDAAGALVEKVLGKTFPPLEKALRRVGERLVPDIRGTTAEITNTLGALNGSFVEPGPSGAPSRGQCDVLPSGRNFYSVDPNKIPSPAAWKIGVAMGDVLIERTLAETGKYPENVGIVVYGSATMRTRGDDIAEIYHLMGLRPVWREGGTVSGLEVVPLSELKRPRIDVTPRISGFFRDSFPNIIETLDFAVELAAKLNEAPESNFIRRHVYEDLDFHVKNGLSPEEAWRESTFRVFGCPPGTYGAGVKELVETKKWKTKDDLGEIYVRFGGHAYGRGSYGLTRPETFKRNLARMDVTVKNEDSREHDMMSCTDYYNYYGGLIVAARTVRGSAPLSFAGDDSDPKRVRIRTTFEEAKHILRARLVNPKWLEGVKRHGYKGAGDISHMMDTMFGWDATADVMEDWMYEKVSDAYVLYPAMKEWMEKVNPYARQNILDKLLEAITRGMWNASEETRQKLRDEYLELEGRLEEWNDRVERDLAV
ncbi:MAG: cobaltochelatase subunit CobN [Deltaproteobacteria bacterium]|nr:cobaltochelatase subunit CobN [Deltaproteobacteria bacterium]